MPARTRLRARLPGACALASLCYSSLAEPALARSVDERKNGLNEPIGREAEESERRNSDQHLDPDAILVAENDYRRESRSDCADYSQEQ
jgi:hypothetical protein